MSSQAGVPDESAAFTVSREIGTYQARSSGRSLEKLVAHVNDVLYQNYSADYNVGAGLSKVVVNPLFEYERLLRELSALPRVSFRTMEQMMKGELDRDAVTIVIRHDIDGDIVAAVEMAKLERSHGIETTYYVLHTAFYYGAFVDGIFERNDGLAPLYLELQQLGHEVSVHSDPLHIYQEHRLDGAAALVEEIRWLRSIGLRVPGSAAHNHTSVYGAQNFEIFKGRVRNFTMPSGVEMPKIDVSEVVHHGKWAPLHVLDEKELGLSYEGHDAYAVPGYLGIMSEIGFNSFYETWNEQMQFRQRGLRNGPAHKVELFDALRKARPGEIVVFTTHPLYYGARHEATSPPVLRLDSLRIATDSRTGKPRYVAGSLAAVSESRNGVQESQSINFANEWGALSRPVGHPDDSALRILLLGGDELDARQIGLPDHLECHLESFLSASVRGPVHVRTLAFPGAGLVRYREWFAAWVRSCRTDLVIAGVGLPLGRPPLADPAGVLQRAADGIARLTGWRLATRLRLSWLIRDLRVLADEVRDHGSQFLLLNEGLITDRAEATLFEQLAADSRIAFVDPYPAMSSLEGPGRALDADGRWTYLGHRVAARVLGERVAGLPGTRGHRD